MKVLMISTDRNIFTPNSAVRERIVSYSEKVEHLSVIIFSTRRDKLEPQIISKHLVLYPTNSLNRWLYVWSALQIARSEVLSSAGLGADLITTQDPFETGMVGALLSKMFSKPLQIQVHTDLQSPYFKSTSFLNRIRVLIAHFIIPRANGIRTVSEKIKKSIEDSFRLKAPVNVLPVFIDQSRLTHSAEDREFLRNKYPKYELFALVVSRLEPEKNVFLAIDSFQFVAPKYPKLALIVVGGGSQEDALKQWAKKVGLEERVKFEGWVGNPSAYFRGADVFLNTSFYEGYGMTLIEARTAGLPVVTTNVGIASELVGEGVGICEVGDLACTTKFFDEFLGKPDLRMRVRINTPSLDSILITKEEYTHRYVSLWEGAVKAGW